MKEKWCRCKDHISPNLEIRIAFYHDRFIPSGWKLDCGTIQSANDNRRNLFLTGHCSVCGSFMRIGKSLPLNFSGDRLLNKIYCEMINYRPFDYKNDDGTYCGAVEERSRWYKETDNLPQQSLDEIFIGLFRKKNLLTVQSWLKRMRNPRTVEEILSARREKILKNGVKYKKFYVLKDDPANNDDMRELIRSYALSNKDTYLVSERNTQWTYKRYNLYEYIDDFGCMCITNSEFAARHIIDAYKETHDKAYNNWKHLIEIGIDFITPLWS